jgi:hypothetical protein
MVAARVSDADGIFSRIFFNIRFSRKGPTLCAIATMAIVQKIKDPYF